MRRKTCFSAYSPFMYSSASLQTSRKKYIMSKAASFIISSKQSNTEILSHAISCRAWFYGRLKISKLGPVFEHPLLPLKASDLALWFVLWCCLETFCATIQEKLMNISSFQRVWYQTFLALHTPWKQEAQNAFEKRTSQALFILSLSFGWPCSSREKPHSFYYSLSQCMLGTVLSLYFCLSFVNQDTSSNPTVPSYIGFTWQFLIARQDFFFYDK